MGNALNTLRFDAAALATGYLLGGLRCALAAFLVVFALGAIRPLALAVIANALDTQQE